MTAEEVVFATEPNCMSIASIDRLFSNPRFKRRPSRKSRLPGLSLVRGAAVLCTLCLVILSVLTTLFPLCNRHLTISASMPRYRVLLVMETLMIPVSGFVFQVWSRRCCCRVRLAESIKACPMVFASSTSTLSRVLEV